MVIEYKIKFAGDTVTVTQTVDPVTAKAKDAGGDFTENPTDTGDQGGDFIENPDDKGGDFEEPPDDRGGTGQGRGRVIAVVLGPLVLGDGATAPMNGATSKNQPNKKRATKAEIKGLLAVRAVAGRAPKGPKKR